MTGSFTFKWAQPAEEVYVTGSFDGWSQSIKLNQEGDAFIATVSLPSEKILYKYVVDGTWTVDTTARREAGDDGIENNVLLPEDLIEEKTESEQKTEQDMSSAAISSAAPDSTTAALAAQVPKETNGDVEDSTISSVAPDSTTAALAAGVPKEARTPSLKNVPGGFPPTPATETSDPTRMISQEDVKEVTPGEHTPKHDDNSEDVSGGVMLDFSSPPMLPDAVTPAAKREEEEEGGDVPEIVKDTLEAVEQKKEVEEVLKEGVPVVQPTTEGSAVIGQAQADIAVAAAAVTATVGGIAAAAGLSSASGESNEETTPAIVPEAVNQSQEAARVSPEASVVEPAAEAPKGFESQPEQEVSPTSEPAKPAGQIPEAIEGSLAGAADDRSGVTGGDAVEAKAAVENQLKDEVKPVVPVQLKNTADNAATSTTPLPKLEVTDPQEATTPLSPTTPVEPPKNGTPKNGSPRKSVDNGSGEPPSSPTQLTRKKNRFSFFGNLKERLHFGKDRGKSKGVVPVMIRKVHVLLFLIVFLLIRQTVIHTQRTMGREGKLGMRALWNSVSAVALFQSCMGTVSGFGSRVWGTIVPVVRSPLKFFHLSSS
ncbi:unnamed protein product [Tuber aestivum]|uniref:AMP-activated protein kinase glycogen-binding domain-containing protein n=1 Tax=Tuber aestivum TaxID=59557 RepID=A0A292Q6I1_9PEZI|nr:unnamed protein product [Tuber aestivum]